MYPVSQEFYNQMRADKRRVIAKCQIDYTSPFMDQSVDITTSGNAYISYPGQTADGLTEPYAKFASLDGSWTLEDGYEPAPGPDEARFVQMGWWEEQLAGVGGAFTTPYPALTVEFSPRPIDSLKVVGDSKREEWPADFSIMLYDKNNTLLHTETVTGNNEVAWSKPLGAVITGVTKMMLEITRWSHEGRQVKILEFFSSLAEVYEGEDIISVRLVEEREVSQGTLPVGNISSNEIEIRLLNQDGKFDVGNINSPLYGLLRANRRIQAWLGVEHWIEKES